MITFIVSIILLLLGYFIYSKWLGDRITINPRRLTPAVTMEDGVDYVAAPPAVLMGHHFSSIAGAGPINGPIQASVFGIACSVRAGREDAQSVGRFAEAPLPPAG